MKNQMLFSSLFLVCFLACGLLHGQPIEFCGTIGPFQAPTNNPDSIEYDRFGNTYLRSEYAGNPPGAYRTLDCIAGYFELQVDAIIPMDIEAVICQVFTNVSSLIIRRQPIDNCGDPVQIQPVIIDVQQQMDPINPATGLPEEDGILGAAASRYRFVKQRNCPNGSFAVQQSNIMRKLHGEPLNSGLDGLLLVDIDPPDPYYLGADPMGLSDDEFDLYSVIFHEVMHLLGFASIIDANGQPNTNFAFNYSPWDRLLHTTTEYDPNGGSQNVNPLLTSDCVHNCYELNQTTFPTIQDFQDAVVSNCTDPNVDIMVGDMGLAPIDGGSTSFPNNLSHLNEDCGDPDFVMQSSIDVGDERRSLTAAEVDILCALGYQTATCDGCFMAISHNNLFNFTAQTYGSCCDLHFSTCVNQSLLIPLDALLCNDFTNGMALEITDVYPTSLNIPYTVSIVGDNIEFISSEQGFYYNIPYTVRGCDCELITREFGVYVGPCTINCDVSDPCQEIVCINGFEDYTLPGIGGLDVIFPGDPFWINGPNNSSDIRYCDISDNTYVHIGEFFPDGTEGVALELENPIEPNCTLSLALDVASVSANTIGALVVKGSDQYPCGIVGSQIGAGCNNSDCGGTTQNYTCITTFEAIDNFSPNCPIPWDTRSITWTNDQSYPIATLIFYPEPGTGGIYLDNITATLSCTPDIVVSHNITPSTVCSGQELMVTHTICAPVIRNANSTNVDYSIILPNNTTLVDGSLTGNAILQEGDCEDILITILIDSSVPVGDILGFIMDYSASGVCTNLNNFLIITDCIDS